MNRLFFLLIGLTAGFQGLTQDFSLTPSQKETSRKQAEELVESYEISLNNLGSSQNTVQEKEYFLTDILQTVFAGEDVLVYNDLDPENKESPNLKVKTYLNNIVTKYYKGLNVNFSDVNISEPHYLDKRSFFIKVELASNLEGVHIDQPINTFEAIDLYLKYTINELYVISEPKIYSVDKHADNLHQFTPVEIDQEAGMFDFTFLTPGERIKFRRGKEYIIEWKGNDSKSPVSLELFREGKSVYVINPVVVGNRFTWNVPRKMDTGKGYSIRITNLKTPENFEDSPAFAIRRRVPTGLKVAALAGVGGIIYFVISQTDGGGDNSLPTPPGPPEGN